MAIYGRTDVLPKQHRQDLEEITGVRGFGGDFERHYYVKSPADGGDAPRDLFLNAMAVQQRLVHSGAKHWALIVVCGRGEAGSFAVLDHYAGTLEDVIESQSRLDAATLHHVIWRIVAGLKEVRRLVGRPHGNLSARNVLVSDVNSPRDGSVVLTDPAPDARAGERDDVEDLGRIVHLLVLGRPFDGASPVPLTPDWADLGRTGKGWLRLCNRMLHPQVDRRMRLRKAAAGVASLGRRRRPWILRPEMVAVVAAVVGLGTYGWNWHNARSTRAAVVAAAPNLAVAPAAPIPRKLAMMEEPVVELSAPAIGMARVHVGVPAPAMIVNHIVAAPLALALQPGVVAAAPRPVDVVPAAHLALSSPVVALNEPMRVRWARMLEAASSEEAIAGLFKMRGDVSAEELTALSPRTRANVLLHRMRGKVSRESAAQLRAALAELPGGGGSALVGLVQLLQQVEEQNAPFDAAAAGPASRNAKAADRIEWKFSRDAAAGVVRFTAAVSPDITREPIELVFRRVEGDGAAGPFYLCTTEVSAGLFSDVTSASDRWVTMSRLLWQYSPRQADPRTGPRAWEWPKYGRPTMGFRRTIVWLEGPGDHYPPELSTPENRTVLKDPDGRPSRDLNPSRHAPMQYVSPDAAIYFSSLLGCRLPTPAEWRAAVRQASATNGRAKPNLRDRTWRTQYQWAMASGARAAFSPGLGMFRPATEKLTDAVWHSGQVSANAEASGEAYDDGTLWFTDVNQMEGGTSTFSHLVGNVAEYVADGGKVFVIGGSALSPPPPVRNVEKEIELAGWQASPGYSDVGFRLAFAAPEGAMEKLRLAVRGQKYLTP